MKMRYHARGTLRVAERADLSQSFISVQASAYDNVTAHGVRLQVSDLTPGGQILDVVLNPEDASVLGNLMKALAESARGKRQSDAISREREREQERVTA
jgi:hypothetical protein